MLKKFDKKFEQDDYSEIHKKYFKILQDTQSIYADPSGWIETFSNVGLINKRYNERLQRYYSDMSRSQIKEKKLPIIDLLSKWDEIPYDLDAITLCHSTTVGSMITLAVLKAKGINNIIFETPNYYATYYQAETIGMNIIQVPTYYNEDFQFYLDKKILSKLSPCIVWLTQPRTALGYNQNENNMREILQNLSPDSYIVIDEATEQFFPSVLSKINYLQYPNVIKIRSLFKGMGVNGLRLASIIHHPSLRFEMADEMEVFQGALDVHSLEHAVVMSNDVTLFKELLTVSNKQICDLRVKAERQILGTTCSVSKIVNGYIGSAVIHLDVSNHTRKIVRKKLIEYCAKNNMPVILGSAMSFAVHNNLEFIRLNYFSRERHILEGIQILASFTF